MTIDTDRLREACVMLVRPTPGVWSDFQGLFDAVIAAADEIDRLRALLTDALLWLADPGTDGKRLRELVARIMAEVMQVDALLVDGGEAACRHAAHACFWNDGRCSLCDERDDLRGQFRAIQDAIDAHGSFEAAVEAGALVVGPPGLVIPDAALDGGVCATCNGTGELACDADWSAADRISECHLIAGCAGLCVCPECAGMSS